MKALDEKELMAIEGGAVPVLPIIGGAAAVVAIYATAREMVREAGAAAAYRDLGY